MKNYISKGFTVVELLIVVIVIGIIASITVVSYNGVQDRAEYARAQTDMKNINEALVIYKAKNGSYPATAGAAWTYQYTCGSTTLNTTFLSSLVPSYLDKMPVGKANASLGCLSYAYRSTGAEYKLIRIYLKSYDVPYAGLPSVEKAGNSLLDTVPGRQDWAWGYWSPGGASL